MSHSLELDGGDRGVGGRNESGIGCWETCVLLSAKWVSGGGARVARVARLATGRAARFWDVWNGVASGKESESGTGEGCVCVESYGKRCGA
eukprot:358816-Chlamydomonas_euryale.AAC.2